VITIETAGKQIRAAKGMKVVVVIKDLRLQVKSLTGLGLPLPRDSVQSALDSVATEMKRDLPAGLRVDGVQVTDDGVAAHFSARNLSIPAAQPETCSPGRNSPASNE
jgi:hypothetical protein